MKRKAVLEWTTINNKEYPKHVVYTGNNMDKVFDIDIDNLPKVQYFLGVDQYDEIHAYCLMMKTGDDIRILLTKQERKSEKFNEEIANLKKYFNAKMVIWK